MKKGNLTSHIEGYLCAVQEQEIETKALRKLREKDQAKKIVWTVSGDCVGRTKRTSIT